MPEKHSSPEREAIALPDRRYFLKFLIFETAVGLVAVIINYFFGPHIVFRFETLPLIYGVAGALPLFSFLLLLKIPAAPFHRIRQSLASILKLFEPFSLLQIALLSAAAGCAEEMMFRGVLQGIAGQYLGATSGLFLAALLFGLGHWITPGYALLAGLAGLYLGWLKNFDGGLTAPALAHGLYDFFALVYLRASLKSTV